MTLDVDGKVVSAPDAGTIARELDSIGEDGLSLVTLSRDPKNSLTASGTLSEGWGTLLYQVDGATRGADLSMSLRQDKVIQIFQAYAKGDDLWEKEFQWEIIDSVKWPVKRLAVVIAIAATVFILVKILTKQ